MVLGKTVLVLTMMLLSSPNACGADTQRTPALKDVDVWLFAGQSNSEGWALLKAPIASDANILFFNKDGQWVRAEEPLNKNFATWTPGPYSDNIQLQRQNVPLPAGESIEQFLRTQEAKRPGAMGGVGPGLMFAKELRAATGHNIGVISTGQGSAIKLWDPDAEPQGALYTNMIERVRASGAKIKGVVWYQGESDALTSGASKRYQATLTRFIRGVRRDLGQPDLPVICVQTGRFVYPYSTRAADWEAVREAQRQTSLNLTNVWLVSSLDLLLEDAIHVGFEGYARLTHRIAEVALSNVYQLSGHGRPITLESAEVIARESYRPMLRIRFGGVSGRLKAEGMASGFEIRAIDGVDPGADYPNRPANVPIYVAYRADFDPHDPSAVILGLFDVSPVLTGSHHPLCGPLELIYGPGLNPHANITDEKDMPLPAFGPIKVDAKPCAP